MGVRDSEQMIIRQVWQDLFTIFFEHQINVIVSIKMKHHVQKTSIGQIPCLNRNWIPIGDINSAFLLLFTS